MNTEPRVTQEAKAMTRKEVMLKAIEGRLTWLQAADILGMTARHMRRLRGKYEEYGFGGLRDGRSGRPRRKRIPVKTISELLRLRREKYADFSIKHFHEFATEKHRLELSYTWTRLVLQEAGLAPRAPGRGKYRRKRERRPMTGMMMHLDGSTHEWIAGLMPQDLIVMLDDADGRILYGRFVPQEGTMSTLAAFKHVLVRYGRFCEFYTDRGSHFCRTTDAASGPDEIQDGQVSRVLKVLGIRQILARSPEARGRSERAFGTIQGRLPQELKLAGIKSYEAANTYLEQIFIPDFNRRFTVEPVEKESAFVHLAGINLELLLSIQHDRIVRGDSTVLFEKLVLQLPPTRERRHYVRCPVVVHEILDGTLVVTFQGKPLARYKRNGELLATRKAAA
jgi:transposase